MFLLRINCTYRQFRLFKSDYLVRQFFRWKKSRGFLNSWFFFFYSILVFLRPNKNGNVHYQFIIYKKKSTRTGLQIKMRKLKRKKKSFFNEKLNNTDKFCKIKNIKKISMKIFSSVHRYMILKIFIPLQYSWILYPHM